MRVLGPREHNLELLVVLVHDLYLVLATHDQLHDVFLPSLDANNLIILHL